MLHHVRNLVAQATRPLSLDWAEPMQTGIAAYERGDYEAALETLTPLAEQGLPRAQFLVGKCHARNGDSAAAGPAIDCIRKAAENGLAEAQVELGLRYLAGDEVERDAEQALGWFARAASEASAEGQYQLGLCHRDGLGTPRESARANRWFRLAAAQGHRGAEDALLEAREPLLD